MAATKSHSPGVRVTARQKRVILDALHQMAAAYGPQGWWPVYCERKHTRTAQGELEPNGYHQGQFDFPRTRAGRWEISCGAVLTQNTAWINVRTALAALRKAKFTTPERVLAAPQASLAALIRPARYFNSKALYLKALATWFIAHDRKLCAQRYSRAEVELARPVLLAVKGVGRETADAILLYAYNLPTFVVDAYTRRIFTALGVIDETYTYDKIRALFEGTMLQESPRRTVEVWQEYHALIVEHARRTYLRNYVPIV